MYQGKAIGEYVYDAWGNCQVIELSIDSDSEKLQRDSFTSSILAYARKHGYTNGYNFSYAAHSDYDKRTNLLAKLDNKKISYYKVNW